MEDKLSLAEINANVHSVLATVRKIDKYLTGDPYDNEIGAMTRLVNVEKGLIDAKESIRQINQNENNDNGQDDLPLVQNK